jgi:hypothetical protein
MTIRYHTRAYPKDNPMQIMAMPCLQTTKYTKTLLIHPKKKAKG